MYSKKVIEFRHRDFFDKFKHHIRRQSVSTSIQRTQEICDLVLRFEKDGTAVMKRPLKPMEKGFIQNEILASKFDFRHWVKRHAFVQREGTGVGRIEFWKSQEKMLGAIAEAEEEAFEAQQEGKTVDGIRIVNNKARQLGATCLARLLTMHRLTLWPDHRAMGASVDDDKILELYTRDKLILDNLPFFMKPQIEFSEKAQHIRFGKLNSSILYQQSQQKTGLGQGRQFELGHLTECASFPNPAMIPHDFFPTLPQVMSTLCILESTPQGRENWWYEFTNEVRAGNWPGWRYVFFPWYIDDKKYRRTPPDSWNPSQLTLAYANRVEATSPDIVGRLVVLDKEQLYWYETTRAAYAREGNLAIFYTNYSTSHEESFQFVRSSALPVEVLEALRLQVTQGKAFELIQGG